MEGQKTLLSAYLAGTLTGTDGKESEAYKISVVYSDGSKAMLRKTYEEFVDLQGAVYELLKKKAGYSKKTSKTLVSALPDLNSTLSRLLSKETDLKKMGRLEEFIKELFTLPPVVTESETVMTFFGAFVDQKGNTDRLECEEELKKIAKESEMLNGRDPLRSLPTYSPLPSRKAFNKQDSSWIPGNLNDETREEIYKRLKQTSSQIVGRRPMSSTDAQLGNMSPRPGLRRQPFTVAANLSDMFEENKDVIEKNQGTPRSQSPVTTPVSSPRPGLKKRPFSSGLIMADMLDERKTPDGERSQSPVASPRSPRQLTQQLSRGKENPTPPPDSVDSGRKESRSRKISSQTGRQSPNQTKHVAVSSFHGEEKGEVSLEKGEEVDVLQKEASGWWYVKSESSEGWAPNAFLVPVFSPRSSSPEIVSQLQKEESPEEEADVQEKQKTLSLTRNAEKGARKISTEMNRRVKFLTVEGIQKRKNPDKNYVYILKVVWSDGSINIVYRQCSDFFFLQENLRKEFPTAIGKEIPVLKGKKFTENCRFCFKDGTCKRRQFMNQFCHELINAPDNISKSVAVMTFCKPRSSDVLPHGQNDTKDTKTSENNDDNDVQISGPVVFEQYIVVADYKKKNKNDISLTAGDTVDVIERNDYGWWLVDREGELGWAPASHLEPVDDGSEITTSKTFPPGQEEVYQSMQSYEAQAEDELSFDVGVMLKVVEKTLDGWWLVRYQGDEGWAPAMFLKKVADSNDSTLSSSEKLDELNVVYFDGDSEGDKGMKRKPPTRRSMVQKSVRRKPRSTSAYQLNETTIQEEAEATETTIKKNSRSISVPSQTPASPRVSPRVSPRPKLKSKSSDLAQGDATHQVLNREVSISSGYGSSPTGSLTSLGSDVFTAPFESPGPLKKCATLPRFEDVGDESAIPRSHSVTSFAQYKKEMEAVNSNTSLGLISPAGKWSPIPAPRKISASRRSPLAGSPPRIQDMKPVSPRECASSELELERNPDYNNRSETPRRLSRSPSPELLFRALYPYISQEDGEITFTVGDVVEVVQRGQNGWWLLKSEKAGLGWGPSNYLESVAN